jgi:hypothetical protein
MTGCEAIGSERSKETGGDTRRHADDERPLTVRRGMLRCSNYWTGEMEEQSVQKTLNAMKAKSRVESTLRSRKYSSFERDKR